MASGMTVYDKGFQQRMSRINKALDQIELDFSQQYDTRIAVNMTDGFANDMKKFYEMYSYIINDISNDLEASNLNTLAEIMKKLLKHFRQNLFITLRSFLLFMNQNRILDQKFDIQVYQEDVDKLKSIKRQKRVVDEELLKLLTDQVTLMDMGRDDQSKVQPIDPLVKDLYNSKKIIEETLQNRGRVLNMSFSGADEFLKRLLERIKRNVQTQLEHIGILEEKEDQQVLVYMRYDTGTVMMEQITEDLIRRFNKNTLKKMKKVVKTVLEVQQQRGDAFFEPKQCQTDDQWEDIERCIQNEQKRAEFYQQENESLKHKITEEEKRKKQKLETRDERQTSKAASIEELKKNLTEKMAHNDTLIIDLRRVEADWLLSKSRAQYFEEENQRLTELLESKDKQIKSEREKSVRESIWKLDVIDKACQTGESESPDMSMSSQQTIFRNGSIVGSQQKQNDSKDGSLAQSRAQSMANPQLDSRNPSQEVIPEQIAEVEVSVGQQSQRTSVDQLENQKELLLSRQRTSRQSKHSSNVNQQIPSHQSNAVIQSGAQNSLSNQIGDINQNGQEQPAGPPSNSNNLKSGLSHKNSGSSSNLIAANSNHLQHSSSSHKLSMSQSQISGSGKFGGPTSSEPVVPQIYHQNVAHGVKNNAVLQQIIGEQAFELINKLSDLASFSRYSSEQSFKKIIISLLLNGDQILTENNQALEFLSKLIEQSTVKYQNILNLQRPRNLSTGQDWKSSGYSFQNKRNLVASAGNASNNNEITNNFLEKIRSLPNKNQNSQSIEQENLENSNNNLQLIEEEPHLNQTDLASETGSKFSPYHTGSRDNKGPIRILQYASQSGSQTDRYEVHKFGDENRRGNHSFFNDFLDNSLDDQRKIKYLKKQTADILHHKNLVLSSDNQTISRLHPPGSKRSPDNYSNNPVLVNNSVLGSNNGKIIFSSHSLEPYSQLKVRRKPSHSYAETFQVVQYSDNSIGKTNQQISDFDSLAKKRDIYREARAYEDGRAQTILYQDEQGNSLSPPGKTPAEEYEQTLKKIYVHLRASGQDLQEIVGVKYPFRSVEEFKEASNVQTTKKKDISFEQFQDVYENTIQLHQQCGSNCIHLKRFYLKIGIPLQYMNRKQLHISKHVINKLPPSLQV